MCSIVPEMFSLNFFSPHYKTGFLKLTIPKFVLRTTVGLQQSLFFHSKEKQISCSFQPIKLHKSLRFIHIFSQVPNFSKISATCCSISPQKTISNFLSEKIAFFLFVSVVLMGCFNRRPAIALPAQTTTSTENMAKRDIIHNETSAEEGLFVKILEKDPRNIEALKVLVHENMRRGDPENAVKYVDKLIEVEPEAIEWRLLLALCYEMMGQLSTAKRLFKEILARRPLLLRALHGLAMVMHKNNEGPAVFDMLNKALDIAHCEKRVTEERNIRILIAQMHVVKGELEEGLNRFQDLTSENPRDFRPYLCQGIIYSLLDQKEKAAEQFETYQALVPEEFPQRGFLDDVVLTAKTTSREQFRRDFQREFLYRK